jgi:replicative DNA helicase
MNLVENAVLRSDKAVLVLLLEMPGESLIMRMLSSLGRIDQTKVRSGQLEDDDWPRLTSAVNLLNDRKLFIDDTAGISPSEMRARTRAWCVSTAMSPDHDRLPATDADPGFQR